jgi:hypothetical protein
VPKLRSREDVLLDIDNKRFAAQAWMGIASGTKKEGVPLPEPEAANIITSTGDPVADAMNANAYTMAWFASLLELALIEVREFREDYEVRRRRR